MKSTFHFAIERALYITIRMLEERRDLHITRLVVARQQFENDVYLVMERYFRVFGALTRRRTSNELNELLSRIDPRMLDPSMNAKGTLPFFVWQWGCYNNRFTHWKYHGISTRIVTFIEEDSVVEDGLVLHQDGREKVCGSGGCVVECVGEFTGRATRAMVAAMFPHLLSDEGYTAALTRQTMRFPTRIFVYFDARGNIVNHVLEADSFAALHAIVEANKPDRMASERFTELSSSDSVAVANQDVEMEAASPDASSHSEADSEASSTEGRYALSFLLN